MRRWIAVVLVGALLAGCGAPSSTAPPPSPAATPPSPAATPPSPAATPPSPAAAGEPVVECLGGLDQARCDQSLEVVLSTVTPSGWTPTHIWINSGLLAPLEDMLFDPGANFPYPMPPDDGQWIGNAEVAFAETDKHAGMNLAKVGSDIVADLIGYVVPNPGWCSGTCPSSSSTDGPYRLELVVSHLDWTANEPIHGAADLSFDGTSQTTISGSAGGVIAFAYAEVGGTRIVEPVWDAACAPFPLDPATPITSDLSKSGAVPENDPNADFLRSFLAGPEVRLPAGSWDITTLATFYDGAGCKGVEHSMQTSVRVTVAD